jgi:hypothetical protein
VVVLLKIALVDQTRIKDLQEAPIALTQQEHCQLPEAPCSTKS